MSSRNSIVGDVDDHDRADSFSDLAGSDASLLAQIGRAPAVPLDDGAPLLPGTVISEQFEIVERLGAGGMAVVYLARDRQLGRPVAIKLQRRPSDPGGLSRALREAMAMARLSHPNVLTVHEIGELGPRIYIVMEHIDGWNARAFVAARRPDRAAIIDLFLQAGEGLAAAHAVGIVHRDFKPDNVLVGRDGRVCVADFGLARVEHPAAQAPATDGDPTPGLAPHVTAEGAIAGTPAYMAPEQRAGLPLDARADQFAFCVALRESLAGGRLPAWLERILRRGCEPDPARRFPSMRALLTAIRRDARAARRRPLVLAGGAALVGLGLAAGLGALDRAPRCTGADAPLVGVWDDARRDALAAAFASACADGTCPEGLITRTTAQLDDYARAWGEARVAACEATHLRGVQSPELLDRRMLCLADRLRALDALVDVWTTADAATAADAPTAVAALPSLLSCADAAHVMARLPPPDDPRLAAAVEAVRTRLAEAAALPGVGRKAAAIAATEPLLSDDATLAYAPLRAEVAVHLGEMKWQLDPAASERHLQDAYFTARASDHDVVAARAASSLVWTTGYVRGDTVAAATWSRHALAETSRRGTAVYDRVEALNAAASLASQEGRHTEALALQDQALALIEPTGRRWSTVLNNRAATLDALGRYAEASAAYEQVLAEERRLYGDVHLRVAATYGNLGLVRVRQGRFDEAVQLQRRALAIHEQARGDVRDHRWQVLLNLGVAELAAGRPTDALGAIDQALALATELLGRDHPDVALCLSARANALQRAGRPDEAVVTAREALDLLEKTYGSGHDEVLVQQALLAQALVAAGRDDEALAWLARAVAGWDARSDPAHPRLAEALIEQADILRRAGRRDEAVAAYTRALTIADASEVEPELVARARAGLAAPP